MVCGVRCVILVHASTHHHLHLNCFHTCTHPQIPALLITALNSKHGSNPEAALCIARALLNFARLPDLREGLLEAGCVEALEVCVCASVCIVVACVF